MLRQRIITALILAAAFFGAVFGLSSPHFAIAILLAMTTAAYEWGRLSGYARKGALALAAIVVGAGIALLHLTGFDRSAGFSTPTLLLFCAGAAIFWIVFAPLWLRRQWPTRSSLPMALLGAFLVLAMWVGIVQLHFISPWLLLGTMLIVWLADTSAYFAGRKFGKRKLAPQISPNKSWEGVYGGLACVALYAALVVMFSTLSMLPAATRFAIVVVAVLLAGVSVVGDLFESWMKRQAGVKDSGRTLPGHGGVLDRIDALIPVLPIATLATLLFARLS